MTPVRHRPAAMLGRGGPRERARTGGPALLWVIAGILLLFWGLGLVADVVGGLIHILLAVVVVVVVLQLLKGRRAA